MYIYLLLKYSIWHPDNGPVSGPKHVAVV